MISIEQIAGWCEPWNHAFAHSKWISGSVTGAHIIALLFGGGFAIAADRLTLRAHSRDRAVRISQLREVQAVHPPVLAGLAVLFISGVLLALSDVETFLPSPVFWIKLALVALLLVNGGLLTGTERALNAAVSAAEPPAGEEALWSRARTLAWSSIALWTATAVAGIVLSNV
jgi:hypothetical protein